MTKYAVKLVAEFEVEAENVAKAMEASRHAIHAIGERAGASRGHHERDFVSHRISRVSETIDKPRRLP